MDIVDFRQAAEQGNGEAQFQLGLLHAERKDYGAAYKWLALSNQGEDALDILMKSMPACDIFKAQRLARDWRLKHNTSA